MKASLNFLHHQNNDWLRELAFYKDELSILTKRLEEAASKNTAQEVLAQVEHFQNKFIMLREQLDILRHDVNERQQQVEKIAASKPEHINEKVDTVRDEVFSRMKDMAHSVADTRYEFNRFVGTAL